MKLHCCVEPLNNVPYVPFSDDLLYACPCSFSDPVRRRCSVLQWNPDVATQLIVASDDDVSPSLSVSNTYVLSVSALAQYYFSKAT